jgi:anti-sigma factor (TIGR02949 family)
VTHLLVACTEAEQHLQEYFDRMLPDELVVAIEHHLEACDSCARAYAFERRFRVYLKRCCGGDAADEHCREEFRQTLQRCRQATP